MMNVVSAKEKAKSFLRNRSFFDAVGFGGILSAAFVSSFGQLLLFVFSVASLATVLMSSIWAGRLPGWTPIALLPLFLVMLALQCVAIGAMLLFHGGMVRASLRMTRRNPKVRILDIVLAGDRLKHNICVSLWILLYLVLWCLIGGAVAALGVYLVAAGFSARAALLFAGPAASISASEVFGYILIALGYIWNAVITVIKLMEYSFSYHVGEDNRSLTAHDCLVESSRLTNGQKFEVFKAYLSFLGWNMLGLFAGIFTIPYQYLTFANLYEQLIGRFQPALTAEMCWQRNGSDAMDIEPVKEKQEPEKLKPATGGIHVVSGEFAGQEFPLHANEELRIGRDGKRANIVLNEIYSSVSGLHCGIRFNAAENAYFVTDYSSNEGITACCLKRRSG